MTAPCFIDTNILLYAASSAPEDAGRRARARELLRGSNVGFSAQVLQEFYVAAVRKGRLAITPDEGRAILDNLAMFPVAPITRETVFIAIAYSQRFTISYWDAAILAAAKALGANTVFSEDFNNGQIYDGITVTNPFLTEPSAA